ncbi:MAG: 3-deoxy-D-manno-octulosonic-acid transferase [Thermoanaerobaculia bacterium]|jgi:3-deoxy-D-manno-octulosonic-acid transferase|nr:3-deoxy-D-manno-octulosonic-acid transferase [Thermoanaerobaculia bacterium]
MAGSIYRAGGRFLAPTIIRAVFVLYDVLLYLAAIALLPYVIVAGMLRGKYLANFPERMGFYKTPPATHDLWIHAVSVGETLAARPVVDEILRTRPATTIVITTTTITGQAQARRLFPSATVTYFPFDFSASVKRFLLQHRPRVFATMETEIWPNATRLSSAAGVRLLLANGRISDRSLPRYRFLRAFVGPLLRRYDRILAREETDRERFIAIGAPAEIVETSGNVKFDYVPDDRPLEIAPRLLSLIAGRKVLVLGSTMQGEDEAMIGELERFIAEKNAFVVVAPRKPERFEIVAALLAAAKIRFVRRSDWNDAAADVLLLDTFGELSKVYLLATAAFVGGSLVPTGGHNPIEPAAVGVPVCFGPYMSNFREIASVFLRDGGAIEAKSAAEVFDLASRMFENEASQRDMSERARKTVEQNRGAATRTAARIIELLS